jgi:hypothetical protein
MAAAVELVAVVWRGGCAHTERGSRVVMVAGQAVAMTVDPTVGHFLRTI